MAWDYKGLILICGTVKKKKKKKCRDVNSPKNEESRRPKGKKMTFLKTFNVLSIQN